jgi:hypothetical protein
MGILSGFDRLVFRGSLREICYAEGMRRYLSTAGVLLKEFGAHAEAVTERVKAASLEAAKALGREVRYLPSAQVRKEEVAREIAVRDGIAEGLICVLTSVEPCSSFEIYRNRATKRLEVKPRMRKCLHHYHYWMHPKFGLMHARIQTWFPLTIQVCLNGREWLARSLDRGGVDYRKRENCFVWLADVKKAQQRLDRQLATDWPKVLDRIARQVNPAHAEIFDPWPLAYYWSTHQSEWATDVMFRDTKVLAALYPRLVRHGITTFSSPDVMRFLGRKVPDNGTFHGRFTSQVISDLKVRPEGVRIKHRVNGNSVKMYDKQGTVLRVETTINEPKDFKVYRPAEGGRADDLAWRTMRRGVADLHRRAKVSQAANERYLDALAQVDSEKPLGQLVDGLCRPVKWKGKRVRALHPWGQDVAGLEVISRGEFALNGFRNRDLREHLFASAPSSRDEARRRSGQVTRKLRILRGHGLVKKVPRTHRYVLTEKGQAIVVALSAARNASPRQLTELVA